MLGEALRFAEERHRGQTRKDAGHSPYFTHIKAVVRILQVEGGVTDEATLVAAALHDTVEDTATTFEEIATTFSADVAGLVREMTDDKSLPKQRRKDLQIEHAPHASPRAKQIKIADKIANIRDIASTPPVDWSDARKREYFDWAEQVVAGCRGMNPALDAAFDSLIVRAREVLGGENTA